MASPITVGATAMAAALANPRRVSIRFQNASATQTLYFVRQIGTVANVPSATNYEFSLTPGSVVFDTNVANTSTNSTAQFNVVASAAAGVLAIYETSRV